MSRYAKPINRAFGWLAGNSPHTFVGGIREAMFGGLRDMSKSIVDQGVTTGRKAATAAKTAAGGKISVGAMRTAYNEGSTFELGKAFDAGFKDASGNMRWGRVAGTASGLAIGYRVISGGGLYRDKNGNFDIAGVPFV
jgi:hypothetical protein